MMVLVLMAAFSLLIISTISIIFSLKIEKFIDEQNSKMEDIIKNLKNKG